MRCGKISFFSPRRPEYILASVAVSILSRVAVGAGVIEGCIGLRCYMRKSNPLPPLYSNRVASMWAWVQDRMSRFYIEPPFESERRVGARKCHFFFQATETCSRVGRVFFTRRDRRGVSKVFALWEVECVFSRIFTFCACVRFTGSGQYESFLPCTMSNYEPSSKGRLFQKMKNHITQTEGEGRKNIIFSSRRP